MIQSSPLVIVQLLYNRNMVPIVHNTCELLTSICSQ